MFMRTYREAPWNENWDPSMAEQRIRDFVDCNISLNYCACDERGVILGVLFARRNYFINAKELFVDEFFVDHAAQHKGIGTFMLDEVAKEIKRSGFSCIILNTEKGYPSESFYLKKGFVQKESNIFMYKNI
jgi:GNAT superfamily N-acetyltransferase